MGKFIKFLIAIALLPFVVAEVWTIIDLARDTLPAGEWTKAWFVSFVAGFFTWLIVYFLLPRTMWLYVLGHEFTHAIASMLAGGNVSSFQVTAKGGHVITDKVNWWITLAPYFVPLYTLLWMGIWLSIDFYRPLTAWQPILYFGLGLTWCFHLTFTMSMIHLKQTDLTSQGFIFSFVVILMMNLLMFLILFGLLAHDLTYLGATEHFWLRITDCYGYVANRIGEAIMSVWNMVAAHIK